MPDIFLTYYVDIHQPGKRAQVTRQLNDHGLVTFNGIRDRASLAAAARLVMTVRPHRDAAIDGVTVITSSGDALPPPGYAGFTSTELSPHTEGSSVSSPPALVMLACLEPAVDGGESDVVDGRRVFMTLADVAPDALRALSAPRSAFFGAGDGHLGSVFEDVGDGRVGIRLRLDELGRFSPGASRILPQLRVAIDEHRMSLRLRAGEGFLLSNSRWLHGRRRFSGQRVILRILGDPLPGDAIKPGFSHRYEGTAGRRSGQQLVSASGQDTVAI